LPDAATDDTVSEGRHHRQTPRVEVTCKFNTSFIPASKLGVSYVQMEFAILSFIPLDRKLLPLDASTDTGKEMTHHLQAFTYKE
jgi:hypothetical protein